MDWKEIIVERKYKSPLVFWGKKTCEKEYYPDDGEKKIGTRKIVIYKTKKGKYVTKDVFELDYTYTYSMEEGKDEWYERETGATYYTPIYKNYSEHVKGTQHDITKIHENARDLFGWLSPTMRNELCEIMCKVDDEFKNWKDWEILD